MAARDPRLASDTVTAPDEQHEPPSRRWWPVAVPLVIFALILSFLIPASRHEWALALFKQPARYTALWFNKSWALPTRVATNVPIPISFVISNQEGLAVRYRYLISQTSAGHTTTLVESASTVASGHLWTVTTTIRPTCQHSPCRIQVSLPGHPETIDFLASVHAS